jgi:HK97 family phage portal protein
MGMHKLVDTAWACLDLNSSVLSAMPVYRMQSGQVVPSMTWMTNPDPMIYTSWQEFAKQLFWDYQMGEAFVMPMAYAANGFPLRFRVVPPWLMNVELRGGTREYMLGGTDVTSDILHIRYQSNTADARGHGPLEAGGARMTAAGLLQRYADRIAETGGTPLYWLEVDRRLNETEGSDLLDRWVESRIRRAGEPALVTGGAKLNQGQSMSARDMTLLELAQFNESRIAVLLGVPPFLVGLPGAGNSLVYSNVESLFDFHDRSSLRPKANAVMSAMSGWCLPRGQTAELNRDEYSRPPLKERAEAYQLFIAMGALSAVEVRAMERFNGESAAVSLTGVDDTSLTSPSTPAPLAGGNDT